MISLLSNVIMLRYHFYHIAVIDVIIMPSKMRVTVISILFSISESDVSKYTGHVIILFLTFLITALTHFIVTRSYFECKLFETCNSICCYEHNNIILYTTNNTFQKSFFYGLLTRVIIRYSSCVEHIL